MKHTNNIDIEKLHNKTQKNNVSIYINASDAATGRERKSEQNKFKKQKNVCSLQVLI